MATENAARVILASAAAEKIIESVKELHYPKRY